MEKGWATGQAFTVLKGNVFFIKKLRYLMKKDNFLKVRACDKLSLAWASFVVNVPIKHILTKMRLNHLTVCFFFSILNKIFLFKMIILK